MGNTRVICDYCQRPATLVDGTVIYPRRPDLASKWFWQCSACDAYVGCHPPGNGDGTKPLGSLANAELRRLRTFAHVAFDPLWQEAGVRRKDAYAWLHTVTGIPKERCHVAMMNETECELVCSTILKAEMDGTLPKPRPGDPPAAKTSMGEALGAVIHLFPKGGQSGRR